MIRNFPSPRSERRPELTPADCARLSHIPKTQEPLPVTIEYPHPESLNASLRDPSSGYSLSTVPSRSLCKREASPWKFTDLFSNMTPLFTSLLNLLAAVNLFLRKSSYILAVLTFSSGYTTTTWNSSGRGNCRISSPFPVHNAKPPYRKKGTSDPNEMASSSRFFFRRGFPKRSFSARSVIAALLLPPPSPPPAGMHFSITTSRPTSVPAAFRNERAAFPARLSRSVGSSWLVVPDPDSGRRP